MALKLLSSKLISTPFYLTLDADVVLLRGFSYSDIVDHRGRGLYDHEPRLAVHPIWWDGSEKYLRILNQNQGGLESENSELNARKQQQGFGVTPALLNTYGSILVINKLLTESSAALSNKNPIEAWINEFGVSDIVWSEYTLYALTLYHYQV
jgi:hypothetical protein